MIYGRTNSKPRLTLSIDFCDASSRLNGIRRILSNPIGVADDVLGCSIQQKKFDGMAVQANFIENGGDRMTVCSVVDERDSILSRNDGLIKAALVASRTLVVWGLLWYSVL